MTGTAQQQAAQSRTLLGRLARIQQKLSDRVHASGDAQAARNRWTVTTTTGRLGFGRRGYHDPRFTTRARRLGGTGERRRRT